jgi:hypothetical protein
MPWLTKWGRCPGAKADFGFTGGGHQVAEIEFNGIMPSRA